MRQSFRTTGTRRPIDGYWRVSNLEDATLAIDLFDGGNDMLDVSRNAFLGGTLEVVLDDGFMPTLGQQFTLLTYGDFVDLNFAHFCCPMGSLGTCLRTAAPTRSFSKR